MATAEVTEPDRKRVRFDQTDPDKEPAQPPSATKKHVLRANEVVQLRFITEPPTEQLSAAASHPPELTTYPSYLHQIIPNEQIYGWTKLLVAVYVHLPSLSFWIDQSGTAAEEEEPTDVPSLIAPFIKNGLCPTRAQFLAAMSAPIPMPLSTPVTTYQRGEHTFAIYKEKFFPPEDPALAKHPSFLNFHLRMSFLMFIHIDGASFIDHDDPRWEVFVLARMHDAKPISFVGYATIYPFSALSTEKEKSVIFAERIRISQVFILPVCQSAGHGNRLLTAIYDDAASRNAMEVTVEDPSRGFRVLRDITDLKRCYVSSLIDRRTDFDNAKEDDIIKSLRSSLFLTRGQARRCLEVHRLRHTNRDDEDAYRKYRLWVKRRLFTENIEVLHQFEGQERKDKLGEIYADYEEEYLEAIERLEGSLKRADENQSSQNQIDQKTQPGELENVGQEPSKPEESEADQQRKPVPQQQAPDQ